MPVVVDMARCAIVRRVLKTRRFVTLRASNAGMLTYERKTRQSVVESHILVPGSVSVALLALRTLLTSMRIIVAVA